MMSMTVLSMTGTTFVQLLDLAVGLVLVTSFAALWLRRLSTVIRVLAVQGLALAAVAAVIGLYEGEAELVAVAVMVAVLRVFVMPGLIMRAVRAGDEHREVESLINVPASLLAASGLTLLAYATMGDVVALSASPQVRAIPIGVAVALIGMLLIISRRKAVLQIMGVLMIDNGIALVMFLGTSGVPLVVELGIACDVLLAMFILQVLTNRIRNKFGGTDLDQLRELRD
jgi:hydrogenase-4 component E